MRRLLHLKRLLCLLGQHQLCLVLLGRHAEGQQLLLRLLCLLLDVVRLLPQELHLLCVLRLLHRPSGLHAARAAHLQQPRRNFSGRLAQRQRQGGAGELLQRRAASLLSWHGCAVPAGCPLCLLWH